MKKFTYLIICLGLAIATGARAGENEQFLNSLKNKKVVASNRYVTKKILVENFNQIRLMGGVDVTYTQKKGSPQVEIYTSDNVVDLLDVEVKSQTLRIGFKKGTKVSYNKLKINVSAEELTDIAVVGSGDFTLSNGLQTNENLRMSVAGSGDIKGTNISCKKLRVSIAGSGDVKLARVKCDDLETKIAGSGDIELTQVDTQTVQGSIAGSGDIKLTGNALSAEYKISGSGDIEAHNLKAERVTADIIGGGDITCHAVKSLKVRTTGSGRVGYKGNPEVDSPKKKIYRLQ